MEPLAILIPDNSFSCISVFYGQSSVSDTALEKASQVLAFLKQTVPPPLFFWVSILLISPMQTILFLSKMPSPETKNKFSIKDSEWWLIARVLFTFDLFFVRNCPLRMVLFGFEVNQRLNIVFEVQMVNIQNFARFVARWIHFSGTIWPSFNHQIHVQGRSHIIGIKVFSEFFSFGKTCESKAFLGFELMLL